MLGQQCRQFCETRFGVGPLESQLPKYIAEQHRRITGHRQQPRQTFDEVFLDPVRVDPALP
jgi:hypothetical protein